MVRVRLRASGEAVDGSKKRIRKGCSLVVDISAALVGLGRDSATLRCVERAGVV